MRSSGESEYQLNLPTFARLGSPPSYHIAFLLRLVGGRPWALRRCNLHPETRAAARSHGHEPRQQKSRQGDQPPTCEGLHAWRVDPPTNRRGGPRPNGHPAISGSPRSGTGGAPIVPRRRPSSAGRWLYPMSPHAATGRHWRGGGSLSRSQASTAVKNTGRCSLGQGPKSHMQ